MGCGARFLVAGRCLCPITWAVWAAAGPSAAARCDVGVRYALATARTGGARLTCRTKAGKGQQARFEKSLGVHTGLEDGDTFTGENTVPQDSLSVDRRAIPGLGPDGGMSGTDDNDKRFSASLGDENLGTSQFRGRWKSTATLYQYVELFDGGNERSQTHSLGFVSGQGRERLFHKTRLSAAHFTRARRKARRV